MTQNLLGNLKMVDDKRYLEIHIVKETISDTAQQIPASKSTSEIGYS